MPARLTPKADRRHHPLHALLRRAGISQGTAAKALGVSRPKLAGILLGYYPPHPPELARELAAFSVELQESLTVEGGGHGRA